MRRREFITFFGAAVAIRPTIARAQQPDRVRRIGILMTVAEGQLEGQASLAAFLQRMLQLGWIDGHNLRIDTIWSADDDGEIIHQNAAAALALAPDVIVAMGASVGPLLKLSDAVPIVFIGVPDALGPGYVKTLARPGGNVTGVLAFEYGIGRKWLELLNQIAPPITNFIAIHEGISAERLFALGPAQVRISTSTADDLRDTASIERFLTAAASTPNSGLIVASLSASSVRSAIIAIGNRLRLPAIYAHRVFVTEGGLISYGPDFADQFSHVAGYVSRILRGEKPADLSVQTPAKHELVVNLKTAKALGLNVPNKLIRRADEVIE
jgi:putative ABC transport system substrate-binding protein